MAGSGVQVCSGEVECAVSAKRMWLAAFKEGHVCLPKALPQAISHISYESPKDNPTPGLTTRTIHLHRSYAEAEAKKRQSDKVVLLAKEKLKELDPQALKLKVEMLEGGLVGSCVKSATESAHIVEGPPAGASCVVHWSLEYEPLSEKHEPHMPLIINDFIPGIYKKLEEYLVTHDDYLKSSC